MKPKPRFSTGKFVCVLYCLFLITIICILNINFNKSTTQVRFIVKGGCNGTKVELDYNDWFVDGTMDQKKFRALRKVRLLNCKSIAEGYQPEIQIAQSMQGARQLLWRLKSDAEVVTVTRDCSAFTSTFGYDFLRHVTMSDVELDNPIAYSIVFHKDAHQVERLLNNIYRRNNVYCLHLDAKASSKTLEAAQGLAKCLDNVFITTKRENIVYAHFSRLQAEFNCMSDLLAYNWTYFINLTGQMFPLKNNREIAAILSTLKGSNDVEVVNSKSYSMRYGYEYVVEKGKLVNTGRNKSHFDKSVTILKGSVFGTFNRKFVEYVLTNHKVKSFLKYLKDTYSPDEFIWATINSRFVNPYFNAPGGYLGSPERKPWMSAYASWKGKDKCAGKWIRTICIFSIGDLASLVWRRELFANKFEAEFHPAILDCLEELLTNRTLDQPPFDLQYYRDIRYYLNEID